MNLKRYLEKILLLKTMERYGRDVPNEGKYKQPPAL